MTYAFTSGGDGFTLAIDGGAPIGYANQQIAYSTTDTTLSLRIGVEVLHIKDADTITVDSTPVTGTPAQKAATLQNTIFEPVSISERVLYSNITRSHTGNTTETEVYSGVIPTGKFGPNSSLHIPFLISATSNTNSKTFRLKINGVTVITFTQDLTSETVYRGWFWISNRNSLTSQITAGIGSGATSVHAGWNASQTPSYTTYTFDTSQAVTISATIQLAVTTDTQALEQMDGILYK